MRIWNLGTTLMQSRTLLGSDCRSVRRDKVAHPAFDKHPVSAALAQWYHARKRLTPCVLHSTQLFGSMVAYTISWPTQSTSHVPILCALLGDLLVHRLGKVSSMHRGQMYVPLLP